MHKFITLAALIITAGYQTGAQADWGSITIRKHSGGKGIEVLFENSVFKARYENYDQQGNKCAIRDLMVKAKNNFDLAGTGIGSNSCYKRGYMLAARIKEETDTKKVIECDFAASGYAKSMDIIFYKDQPFITLLYRKMGCNEYDYATNGGDTHAIYNWDGPFPIYPACFVGGPYCDHGKGVAKSSEISYKNKYIVAGYHKSTGIGYGRVMPNSLETIKLLRHGMGFEFFMTNKILPYKSYVYIFTKGHDDAIESGKKIADWAAAGETGLPFDNATSMKAGRAGKTCGTDICTASRDISGNINVRFHAQGAHSVNVFNSTGSLLMAESGIVADRYAIRSAHNTKGVLLIKVANHNKTRTLKLVP